MKIHKTAVLQMFYGENGNADNLRCTHEEIELLEIVESNYDLLCEKLKPQKELWELFLKYKESLEKLQLLEADCYYAEGFKFGLLIGVEAGESKFDA
ncbi:MAG: hypothetical protein K2N14_01635 [Clostridia bacterium]|nr:hypothetical protein [Clostridia bacterium]